MSADGSAPGASGQPAANPQRNGEAKPPKQKEQQKQQPGAKGELSNAEKKKLAKAEKSARRAAQKQDAPGESNAGPSAAAPTAAAAAAAAAATADLQRPKSGTSPAAKGQHKRAGSAGTKDAQQLPVRQKAAGPAAAEPTSAGKQQKQQQQLAFFDHLYVQTRRRTLAGVSKDVHPAIQALGMQISHYQICGSHARCVAMMLALKSVVQDYKTPQGTSLPRDLSSHHLSPQLNFIKSCRPFSVAQSNSIRWLKNVIANVDPSTAEMTAKSEILAAIDTFVQERLTVADQVIAEAVTQAIDEGDHIVTFAKSAVVTNGLIAAAEAGRVFRVTVVDSRPLHEGRNLARRLTDNGIETFLCSFTGISHATKDATKCILGAHAVLGNGAVYSRIGTAAVAMAMKAEKVPVIALAESIKFTERVSLDSIIMNELAPEDELADDEGPNAQRHDLWRSAGKVQLLNPMFDLTPPENVSIIATELGNIPPGSAAIVQRMSGGAGEAIF